VRKADQFENLQDPNRLDGRTARRVRNRDAVLDAVLELFAEGSLEPTATEVAERSGVSLRSVYRYFEDTDALIRSAIARNVERVRPLGIIEGLGEGPLESRIDVIVATRFRLYEATAPLMRATMRRAPSNRILSEQLASARRALRAQVDQMFSPELGAMGPRDRQDTAATLDVLLSFATIEQLREAQGLSPVAVRRILSRAVAATLSHTRG
jgi:AcrR family transcriptional regulator